ncbi:Metallo-dependent phosphatase-like [Sesbania bispinosa]|nr:Metallo-dependent phosphatase-like [Sesbania bispinosa]
MKQQELTVLLCLTWALTLLYGEMFAFRVPPLFTCSWPHLRTNTPSSTVQTESGNYQTDYVKVAVIADPQLMDKTSLRLPENSLALEIAEFYTDLNMRRSFFASILPFKPDVILFLGDYFDGGPYLSDEEWKESFNRFKHIFGLNAQGKYADKQVYYIPGNHDIGYESLNSRKPEVIRRYEETFGIRNYRFAVGKVDFIAVDAQTLDGHPQKHLASQTWEFVKNHSVDDVVHPRVLLTHIPLYRHDDTYCGPDRGSPIINQRIHHAMYDNTNDITYQNYVFEESSKFLLDTIKPKLILSGHDHDQCTVTHQSKFGPVNEHTLGTISWQQGNLYPSFMLLSVGNSTRSNASIPEEVLLTHLCYLPMQTHIYIWYAVLFVLTLLALLLWPTSSTSFWHQCWSLMGHFEQLIACIVSRNETKEKDEDANYEYEMMWDAEGSMHLVKKPLNASIVNSNERSSGERGNVVMRPTARKNTAQEADHSVNVDIASGIGLDPLARIPPRAGKSKTTFIIQRLLRTLRMLTVIAAVNVPLYMMFLFKDWIDK